jgi:hypothetical protein
VCGDTKPWPRPLLGVLSPLEDRVGSQAHVFLDILSFSPASFAFVADAVYNISQSCTNPGPQVALNFVPYRLIILSPQLW